MAQGNEENKAYRNTYFTKNDQNISITTTRSYEKNTSLLEFLQTFKKRNRVISKYEKFPVNLPVLRVFRTLYEGAFFAKIVNRFRF